MTERPDSSLSILDEINPEDLHSRRQRANYALLLSMALDKNYIDITDDSVISIAYNYYLRHPGKRERMLSTYYNGVIKQNAGNYISAAIDFDQALALAKDLKDDHHCGLACRHLSSIHAFNYNHVLSLDYARQSANYFDSCEETLSADYARINMAEQLSRNKNWQEAMEITDTILCTNTYQPLQRIALWIKTDLLIVWKQEYNLALSYLEQIPIRRHKKDSLSYYEYKAFLCDATGKREEADLYFNLAEGLVDNSIDSLTLLNLKSGAYRLQGDYKNAYNALSKATDIQYQEISLLLGQSVSHALENHYRESLKNHKERNHQNNILYISLAALLLMIIVLLSFITRKLRHDKLQDIASIESLTNDLQILQDRNQHFRQASNAVIIDKVRFLQQLSDSYFSWTDEEVRKREKEKGSQTKDEIISVFRKQLGEMRADKSLISSLEEAVNASNDNIIRRLRQEYNGVLKENDFAILTMMFSGLSIKSIAFFLRMSEPSLRTRKYRYKSLFQDQPAPSSQDFIRMLG